MNADAARVGAAPTAEDIGVAPANYTGPVKDKVAPYGLSGLVTGQTQPTLGVGKSFARGAVAGGTFGLFSVLNSAADTAAQHLLPQAALDFVQQHGGGGEGLPVNEPHTYDERRQAYQGLLHEAKAANPKAYLGGELAGSLLVPVPGAGAAGNAAGKLGTKLGGKVLGGLANTATNAAVSGAVYGAGDAAGEGKDAADIAKGFGKGALAGAVTGAAIHGVAGLTGMVTNKALDSLSKKYVQLFGAEVAGGTQKSTRANFAALAGREDKAGIKAAENYIKSKDLAPVEKAAASGLYEEALQRIDDQVQKLSPARAANYKQVKDTFEFKVGDGLDSIRNHQFIARNSGSKGEVVTKPLNLAEKAWIKDFSTADAGVAKQALLRPVYVAPEVATDLAAVAEHLPTSGFISRRQWLKAALDSGAGPEAKAYLTSLEKQEGPDRLFKWNPDATIDPLELRAEATNRAEQASAGLNSLQPQFATARKDAVSKAINGALEKYLDQVAATGKAAKEAVARIRADDVKWNVLLTAKSALKQKLANQTNNMFNQAPAQISKMHGPTATGVGIFGANAAIRSGIRHSPRLQESIANLPPTSPLAARLATRGIVSQQQPEQPPAPQPVTGSTSFGTAGNGP
jgi:hypothetical protein